jgi:hypothetical protein
MAGTLISGGPPDIFIGTIAEPRRRITWVDLRNYFLADHTNIPDGIERLKWIGQRLHELRHTATAYDLGALKCTASSWAFSTFRRSHLTTGLYCHARPEVMALEAAALHGGRCEAFWIGQVNAPVYHLDFQSMYGALASLADVPVRLRSFHVDPDQDRVCEFIYQRRALAEVEISTNFPIFPVRHDGLVIYPVGTFETTLAGPELREAYNLGYVNRINRLAVYDCEPALKSVYEMLLALRREGKEADGSILSPLAKGMMVGLLGKLGQKRKFWESAPEVWTDLMYGEWLGSDQNQNPCRYRAIAGSVQREITGGFAADSVPAITAWIMAWARLRLWQAMNFAGRENVFYVDTDSLFTNQAGMESLMRHYWIRPGRDGFLQCKGGPATFEVRGIKYYVFDGVVTCAGCPQSASVQCSNGTHYFYSTSPDAQIRDRKRPFVETTLHAYGRGGLYQHGIVDSQGNVKPFTLEGKHETAQAH